MPWSSASSSAANACCGATIGVYVPSLGGRGVASYGEMPCCVVPPAVVGRSCCGEQGVVVVTVLGEVLLAWCCLSESLVLAGQLLVLRL